MRFPTRALLLLLLPSLACGCVRRVVDISSDPDGAVVWLNDREIGTTPVEVEIIHYGEYDVQVLRPGYESITTSGNASAPVWDLPGFDVVSEILPMDLVSRNTWHYELAKEERDSDAVVLRAEALRTRLKDEESGSE